MGDEASRLTVRRAGRRAEAGEGRAWGTAAPAELPAFPHPVAQGPPAGLQPLHFFTVGLSRTTNARSPAPLAGPSGDGRGRGTHALQPWPRGGTALAVCVPDLLLRSLRTPCAPLARGSDGLRLTPFGSRPLPGSRP